MQQKINPKQVFKEDGVAIKVEHLYGVYNENKENQFVSLCDINYTFKKHKIYCIIGNSGSGKSTLVTHFNGLLKSRYGNILVQNNYPIGRNFFLNDYLLGIIKPEDLGVIKNPMVNHYLKRYADCQCFVGCFKSNLTSSLMKLLFEAYYKVSVWKVQKIKLDLNGYYALFILNPDNDYRLEVKNPLSLDKLNDFRFNHINELKLVIQRKLAKRKIKKIKQLRKTVGMVFQFPEYQLFKDTIIKDVMFGPVALGDKKEEAEQKSIHYLAELGIPSSYLTRSPFGLSGGQKRRVAIAGILAIEPEILIFDEPTAGLDPMGEIEMLNIIRNARDKGKTVIVITHTMDHVLEIADEVIVMNDGEIIKHGSPYEIFMDEELLKNTSIDSPRIIEVIRDLISQNPNYTPLLSAKPRTIEELADAITEIIQTN